MSVFQYYSWKNTQLSVQCLGQTLICAFLSFFLFYNADEKEPMLKGNYLSIAKIFIIGFVIVHFFEYLAYVIGEKKTIIGIAYYSSFIINESILCSYCAMLSFFLGYLTFRFRSKEKRIYKLNKNTPNNSRLIEFLMPFFLLMFYILADKRYFQAGGNGLVTNSGGLSTFAYIFQTLFQASLISCAIIRLYETRKISVIGYIKSYSGLYYLSVVLYFGLVIISGDRGPLIYMLLAFVFPYFAKNRKKLSIRIAIVILFVGVLSLNFLGALRSLEGEISDAKLKEAGVTMNENMESGGVLFRSTAELSNVIRAYNCIYDFTEKNGIIYGLSFVDNTLGIIPGLRPLIVYPIIGIEHNYSFNTAFISTKLLQSDHGMGTTCVADSYYNFGFWGTIIVFFLFGTFIRFLDLSLYKKDSISLLAFSVCYLAYAIYISRSNFFSPLNLSIYCIVLLWINNKLKHSKLT